METSSLSFSGTNQTYPSNSNAQISIAQPPQVIAEPQTVTLCDFQNQPIAAKPQQVTLRDFQNQPIAAKPRQVTLSDLQGQPIIVQHQQVNLGDLQNQPMTAQPQQLTLVDLQNQNRTHMQEQLNRERVRNLSGDALVQAELNSATSQINALLGNSTVGDVTIGNTTIGNSGIGNASIISDLDQNKLFSNTAPQIINLVLNPGVTSNIMVSTATETTPQQPTVIKPTNTQYDLQLPVRPTVQQLLNQHQKQNQSTPPSNKTVTIIQNTSLQALLQGLGQTQASVTVTQASGMPLATVLQNLGQTQSPTSVTRSTGAPLATVLETTVPPVGQNMKREPVMFDLGGSLSDNKPSVFPAAPSQSTAQHSIKQSRNRSEGTIQSMLSSIRSQTLADSRRRSAGSSDSNIFGTRKDGDFLVPSTTVVPKLRPRSLAPAPPSGSNAPVTVSNNVLAQLLTQGQGQGLPLLGGGMGIKQEEAFGNLSAFKPIQPAPVSLNKTSCITTNTPTMATASDFTVTATNVSDFQRNLLLAAVNQAIGSGTVQFPELTTNSTASPIASLSDPSSPPYNPNSPQFILPSPGSPTSELGPTGKVYDERTPINKSRSRHASNDSTGSASGYRDTDFDFQNALKPFRPKNEVERAQYKEMRRASHINAEQKRRGNIKVGFEMLHQLVPALRTTPSSKSSIANTLGKSADYCRKLKQERGQMQDEAEILRQEIDSLNNSISLCQSQLPATGVPVTRQRADQMREKFDNYVRGRTLQNWKFWIFSIIIQNLLDSYNKTVSTSSIEELCRTVLAWLEQHCSLVALRPTVLNSLRQLCTTTSILSDPSKVPQQATQAVQNPGDLSTNMGSSS